MQQQQEIERSGPRRGLTSLIIQLFKSAVMRSDVLLDNASETELLCLPNTAERINQLVDQVSSDQIFK